MESLGSESPIKTLQRSQDVSQTSIAENLGVSSAHLSQITSGKKTLSWDHCKEMADLYDIDPVELLIEHTSFVFELWIEEVRQMDGDVSNESEIESGIDGEALSLYFNAPDHLEQFSPQQKEYLALLNNLIGELSHSTLFNQFFEFFKVYMFSPQVDELAVALKQRLFPQLKEIRQKIGDYYKYSGLETVNSVESQLDFSKEDVVSVLNRFSENHGFQDYEKLHHRFVELITEYGNYQEYVNKTGENMLGDEFGEGLYELMNHEEVRETVEMIMEQKWSPVLAAGEEAIRRHFKESENLESNLSDDAKEGGST